MMKITINLDGVDTVYTFTDIEVLCLKNDLLNIPDWIRGALTGKISCCKTRMIHQEWMPKLLADQTLTTIPAKEDDLIVYITSRNDYLNRVEREERKT